MTTESPSLEPAINALKAYADQQSARLSNQEKETLLEVERRLQRLGVQAKELMDLNGAMWAATGFSTSFDAATDEIIISVGDHEQRIKLKRANPDVPISMKNLTTGGAYHAGSVDELGPEDPELRLELETKLESYYQSAHRILKLLGTIRSLPKIRCMAMTQVRNNLIEHPEEGALYSFGFGSTGPRVKPMHRGEPVWNDEGLVPNTRDFVEALVAGFAKPDGGSGRDAP